MANGNYYRSPGHGVLPDNLGRAGNLFSIFDFNNRVPPLPPGSAVTAISRDAPVKDTPVTLTNPFDFSRSPLGVLVNEHLWHHLLFDPDHYRQTCSLHPISFLFRMRRCLNRCQ
jgi:hypothetical protein